MGWNSYDIDDGNARRITFDDDNDLMHDPYNHEASTDEIDEFLSAHPNHIRMAGSDHRPGSDHRGQPNSQRRPGEDRPSNDRTQVGGANESGRSHLDASHNENSVLLVMEFLSIERAEAIAQLQRFGWSVELAVAQMLD